MSFGSLTAWKYSANRFTSTEHLVFIFAACLSNRQYSFTFFDLETINLAVFSFTK